MTSRLSIFSCSWFFLISRSCHLHFHRWHEFYFQMPLIFFNTNFSRASWSWQIFCYNCNDFEKSHVYVRDWEGQEGEINHGALKAWRKCGFQFVNIFDSELHRVRMPSRDTFLGSLLWKRSIHILHLCSTSIRCNHTRKINFDSQTWPSDRQENFLWAICTFNCLTANAFSITDRDDLMRILVSFPPYAGIAIK